MPNKSGHKKKKNVWLRGGNIAHVIEDSIGRRFENLFYEMTWLGMNLRKSITNRSSDPVLLVWREEASFSHFTARLQASSQQ